ncbi:MAG: arylsulfatase [Opitutae bacterium]|nr:arylsulfatase [Opitutae bacterium]
MRRIVSFFLLIFSWSLFAKPNIVVFLTDDQGWGDLSLNGNVDLSTPNIDSLAEDGASFDSFYVCPVCSPTRAEFLTGRYHPRSGVYSTSAGGERLDLDETTIADLFQAAGYRTGAFGKWHNGMQFPYHPNGRGFEEYYGFCSGHWGDYFSPPLERNGKLVQGKGFCIDDFTNEAMAFMEKSVKAQKPFFAYLPYNTPHSPMQVPDRFWNKFKDKELKLHHRDPHKEKRLHQLCALAMCENIDWNVGRLLAKLDKLKVTDDTIVLFFHDNGPNGSRWNGDMRGRKGSTDEGGVRSPLLVRWPKGIKPGTKVPQIAAAIDLLPTLADLCDIPAKTAKKLDGISLKPLLTGRQEGWSERILISHWKGRTSARNQRFRLDNKGKLYDIPEDPGQRIDVGRKHPKVNAELLAAVKKFDNEVASELGTDDRPFVIAHPGAKRTQIPARDATVHGGLKRSNKFPNCSFFTNWTKTEDKLTWEVEVGASGKYLVEMWYTCPKKDLGSVVQLSFTNKGSFVSVGNLVQQANDPPLRGMENDRSPRTESYVKAFKPMKLGVIELKKGKGMLTLQALKIPGSQALEFRLLMLTIVDN